MKRRCDKCGFWKHSIGSTGQCRIDPPRVFQKTEDYMVTGWPETEKDDWCGHFVKKGKEPIKPIYPGSKDTADNSQN